MKRLLVVIALLLTAGYAFGETMHVETFGGWACFETRSMMDAPHWGICHLGESNCSLAHALRGSGAEYTGVGFGDYLGGGNESHEEPLHYVSDLTEVVTLRRGLYRATPSMVRFTEDLVVETIMAATELMFRTYDYRGNQVDALFLLDPDDTAAAFAWLWAQG